MTIVDQIITSLQEEPEKWKRGDYTLKHTNGVRVWVANGFWFLQPHRPERKTTFPEKCRLWWAIRRWDKSPITINNGNGQPS
jgi:hypothetical protein